MKSQLKEAKEFKRWVTGEVLPQIRMTGGYVPVEKEDTEEEIMAKAFLIAQRTIEKKEEIIKQKDQQLKEQAPKVETRKQPITSTNELLELENKYKLSTEDVLKIELGCEWMYEENEPNVKVNGTEIKSSVV